MENKTTVEKIKDGCEKMSESPYFYKIMIGLAFLLWTIVVFQAGMFVGFKKASFFFKFGDNYYKGFRAERSFPIGMNDNDFPKSHGAIGKVIDIKLPRIIIADNDGIEKVIILNNRTLIKKLEEIASTTDMKINDFAVVIGSPNENGEIEARLIRIVPEMEEVNSDQDTNIQNI